MKELFTTHEYEYNCNDGTVTDVHGNKMAGVDEFIDEMNLLIREIRKLQKEDAELKDDEEEERWA
tara:strand:- start:446 stop:640 length:195 start_codon:yes stop_codon:yes gene_type:complete